jgi:hypothetical protein
MVATGVDREFEEADGDGGDEGNVVADALFDETNVATSSIHISQHLHSHAQLLTHSSGQQTQHLHSFRHLLCLRAPIVPLRLYAFSPFSQQKSPSLSYNSHVAFAHSGFDGVSLGSAQSEPRGQQS